MDFDVARPTHAADDIGASVEVLQAAGQEAGQQSRCLQAEDRMIEDSVGAASPQ